jgi:NAD-dependent SIR2 family protein deacetylase
MKPIPEDPSSSLSRAAVFIRAADALIITAGAGMGVDSGLPDFRGPEGFWRAYPAFAKLGLRFEQLANPAWFARDPHLAWGFYGHRLHLYRDTKPHAGFEILRQWIGAKPAGGFVFTSNVDGHFQRAGFSDDTVVECHGSLNHLQCAAPCCDDIWPADGVTINVDPDTCRAADPLPTCPRCGGIARPNVLMFGDADWISARTSQQERRFGAFISALTDVPRNVTVIELGAGMNVPTVRLTSERLAASLDARLIRINPREPRVPAGQISLPLGALEALQQIDGAAT